MVCERVRSCGNDATDVADDETVAKARTDDTFGEKANDDKAVLSFR